MRNLRSLQSEFQNYVFKPGQHLRGKVVSTRKASANVRLNIYVSAYRARLLEALRSDYPALHAYLGDEDFEKLANDYLEAHPSKFANIRWYGANLLEFLRAAPLYCKQAPLQELVAFEWAMTLAFDAADDPVIRFEDVGTVPADAWAELRFSAHSSVQRLELAWNVAAIWKAMNAGESLPRPKQSKTFLPWIVWRKELGTYFRSLTRDEAWAFDALCRGQNFAEICSGLCKWKAESEVAPHAAGLLKSWIAEGLVAQLSYR